MTKIIDISLPLRSELPVWPGNEPFKLEAVHRLAEGAHCNESSVSFNIHTGTHIDVPWHFLDDGHQTQSTDLARMIGPALVVWLPEVSKITAQDLENCSIPEGTERLLFRTRNSKLWARNCEEFEPDFVALTEDAAAWVAAKEIGLVGIDYLSIQRFHDSVSTHEVLLAANIVILEGLNLHNIAPGVYELICLPLSINGAEGAPVRAVLRNQY